MGKRINPDARFDRARSKASQQANAEKQANAEAIQRRFASIGQGSSGAAIKTLQKSQDSSGKRLSGRMDTITGLQEEDALRRQQVKDARDFARSERKAGQGFAAKQALLGREFSAAEAQKARDIQSSQFDKSFKEQQAQFQKNIDLKNKSLSAQADQFAQQFAQSQEYFKLEKDIAAFNKKIAQATVDANSRGLFGQVFDATIFGKGGVTGTGSPLKNPFQTGGSFF